MLTQGQVSRHETSRSVADDWARNCSRVTFPPSRGRSDPRSDEFVVLATVPAPNLAERGDLSDQGSRPALWSCGRWPRQLDILDRPRVDVDPLSSVASWRTPWASRSSA